MSNNPFHQAPSGHPIRLLPEWEHDPYHARRKWSEPTQCPNCGAIYHQGRWQWDGDATNAESHRCPACQRIHDHAPAGYLTLKGAFIAAHHDEIENLIRNVAGHANDEHPLQRLIAMEKQEDGTLEITLTDPHLTRGLGEALHKAYAGDLQYHYQEGDYLLRVHWQRD